jgi:iron(III) transport system substrate-binding protein
MVFSGCKSEKANERTVVIYTSVDQIYSEPILNDFQRSAGIRVLPVFDVEATKTTGLVNRLIAEKKRPQADVFWNGEFAQTIILKQKGVLTPYNSPKRINIPEQYRDPDAYWTGFAARARVLIVNTDLIRSEEYPTSIFDLLDVKWPANRVGIAYPLFGTTATHAAAIYAKMGPKEGKAFFQKLFKRGVRVVDGNSVVRDLVASGQLMFGLTDTDDACRAVSRKDPVAVIFPDQKPDAIGTPIIPNTVAMIANAPHKQEAKLLIDFLLSEIVEKKLIKSGWCHIPVHPLLKQTECITASNIKGMDVNLEDIYRNLQVIKKELIEIFIQ